MRANFTAPPRATATPFRRCATALLFVAAVAGRGAAQGSTTTFVPGTRDLFVLDFAGLKKDELPKGITAKGKEKPLVVTKDGVTMLKGTERTELLVHLPENLPAAFTLQFEITPKLDGAPEDVSFEGTVETNRGDASMNVVWQVPTIIVAGGGEYFQMPMPDSIALTLPLRPVPIDVSFDGGSFRLFTDGKLLVDLTNRQFVRGRIVRVVLGGGCNEPGKCVTADDIDKYSVYMSKLRIAAGGGVVANQNTTQTTNQTTSQSLSDPTNRNTAPKTFTVTVVSGQNGPVVSWPVVTGANGYAVSRTKIDDVNCCNNASGSTYGAVSPWQDAPLPTSGTYVYRVVANTPIGQVFGETQFGFRKPGEGVTSPVTAVLVDPVTTGTITPTTTTPPSTVTKTTMADRSAPLNVPTGPAPTNLRFAGIPNMVQLEWDAVPGAVRYELSYAAVGSTTWAPLTVPASAGTPFWVGSPSDPTKAYTYRLIAYQGDGRMGETKVDYKTPTMEPKNFAATPIAPGQVRLEWDNIQTQYDPSFRLSAALNEPAMYLLSGPGTGTGFRLLGPATTTSERNRFTLSDVPAGPQTWALTVSWDPGGVLTPEASWTKASATVAPVGDTATKYRLVALGFKAIQQSKDIDDAHDGHGDEVYFSAIVNRTQLTGDSLPVTKAANLAIVMSRSHGDEAVSVPYGRIKAGTADSTGGIKTGDVVPANLDLGGATRPLQKLTFPLLLWEGSLKDSEVVVIHPTLWEDDVNPIVHAMWAKAIFEAASTGYQKEPVDPYHDELNILTAKSIYRLGRLAPVKAIYELNLGSLIVECTTLSVNLVRRPCEAHGVDRPLGLRFDSPSQWNDKVVVLTRAGIEWAMANVPRKPEWSAGTFAIPLKDDTPPGNEAVALYELYLRLERVP